MNRNQHGNLNRNESERMAPYSKALQVADYDGQCPCVHAQVASKARELTNTRVQMAARPTEGTEHEMNVATFKRLSQYMSDHEEAHRAAVQELIDKATPDPNCQACGGSGTVKTTTNPNGKWSRWEIGVSAAGFVLEGCLDDVPGDSNIVPVEQINLTEAPMPAAIVTPDGQWHAAGELDWFGTRRIDDPNWYDHTARKIVEQYPDAILVVVECHT